jgi:hypothetical protein
VVRVAAGLGRCRVTAEVCAALRATRVGWLARAARDAGAPWDANPSVSKRAERGQVQRDWIAASAGCDRQPRDALAKAAEALTGHIPGRRPDAELARAWAEVGQGWATLSHAEAARSIAAATFAADQGGVNTFPGP